MRFDETELNDAVLDALDAMGFSECTPIQEAAIPPLIAGRDLIGVAQTGTGKTAAFLLPILNELSYGDYPQDAVNCIIMAPTRELAKQIDEQLQGFSYFVPVSSTAVYGGNDGPEFARQRKGLKLGADIVVATPGRLISHISMGYVDLSQVSFFILDEADRMLDMGFSDDILQIASYLPKERQTIMFSATMPQNIKALAKTILNNPVHVEIAVSRPADNILQQAVICYETQKLQAVKAIFSDPVLAERALIFSSSKMKVKELARTLRTMHYDVAEMHSDLDQAQRDEVMLGFRSGRIKMLVATDIVARGIDIDDIRLVMNFDAPYEAEDYVHRIGRTARAGAEGRAITLVAPNDMQRFRRIEKFLGKQVERLVIEGLDVPGERTERKAAKSRNRRHQRRDTSRKPDRQHRERHSEKGGKTHVPKPKNPVQQKDTASPSAEQPAKPRKRRHHRKPRNKSTANSNKNQQQNSLSSQNNSISEQ